MSRTWLNQLCLLSSPDSYLIHSTYDSSCWQITAECILHLTFTSYIVSKSTTLRVHTHTFRCKQFVIKSHWKITQTIALRLAGEKHCHQTRMIERIYMLCLIIIIKSEVWTITHYLGIGHETMLCPVCLSIFWICDMAGLLRGTFVSWWYLPRMWPSVTDMQHYYHAWYPTDDWHLACMFSLIYCFSAEVCLEGFFPHSVSKARSLRQGLCLPHAAPPPLRKKQNRTGGDPSSPLEPSEGGIWTDAWVCLHYLVVIWVSGWSNFHLYCTVYGVCHRQNTLWPWGRILF